MTIEGVFGVHNLATTLANIAAVSGKMLALQMRLGVMFIPQFLSAKPAKV